jgi:stage II sporulation protein M
MMEVIGMGFLDDAVDEIAQDSLYRRAWYAFIVLFGVVAMLVATFYNKIVSGYLGQYLLNETQSIRSIASFANTSGPYFYAALPGIIFAKNSLTDIIDYALLITIVFPFFVIVLNGGLVGFVSVYTLPLHGNALAIFYFLAPHGVIEIPAFSLVASSMVLFFKRGIGRTYALAFSLLVLSVLLLVVAAIMESSVTLVVGSLVQALTNRTALHMIVNGTSGALT